MALLGRMHARGEMGKVDICVMLSHIGKMREGRFLLLLRTRFRIRSYVESLDEMAETVYKRFLTGQASKGFFFSSHFGLCGWLSYFSKEGVLLGRLSWFFTIFHFAGLSNWYRLQSSRVGRADCESKSGFHALVDHMVRLPVTAQEMAGNNERGNCVLD